MAGDESSSSRGTRTLLLFGLVTLLSGLELCGERLVDLYALRPAKLLSEKDLLAADDYERVRFEPKDLRFRDALYYRSDLKTFSEQDPRTILTVNGATELAALAEKRRDLHGVHLVIDNVALAPPAIMLDADTRWESLRGEAKVERMYAALEGTAALLWVGAPIAGDRAAASSAFTARTRFEGTVNAFAEEQHFDDLTNHIRAARPAFDPESALPYVVLEGQPVAPTNVVTRLIPLGGTYNLFVAAPGGVDLASTPAEGTIDKAIEYPSARGSLRRMVFAVRNQTQQWQPLRVIHPGDARSFRASPNAPWVLHPGGAILLLLGVVCSVVGIVLGARRDRSGTEGKLWFEGAVGLVELAAVVVPAAYFLLNRGTQPPAPLIGGSPAVASVEAYAHAAPAAPALTVPTANEKPEDLDAARSAIADIKVSQSASSLSLNGSIAATACAKISAAKVPSTDALRVCGRERALAEIQTAIAILSRSSAEKKAVCQVAGRAARRLIDEKLHEEKDIAEELARLGKACM